MFDGYNQVKLENINLFSLIKNIYNYLTFFIFYLWIPIIYFFILKFKKKNIKLQTLSERKIIGDYFAIIIILGSSITPYLLLNKSTDLFFFNCGYG